MKGSIIEQFMPIWQTSPLLGEVMRWGKGFHKNNKNELQSTLEHINQFCQFVDVALIMLNPFFISEKYCTLDTGLILRCARYHDNPEGLLRRDIPNPQKRSHDDAEEYEAFMESISCLSENVAEKLEYAFLLQFALGETFYFPEKAKKIMQEIKNKRYDEAFVFKSLEKFEYLFFPISKIGENPELLSQVIQEHIFDYRNYAEKIPGFREKIFTKELESWMLDYIYPHQYKLEIEI